MVHFLCQNGRRRQEQLQKGLYDHNWRECRVKSAQLGDISVSAILISFIDFFVMFRLTNGWNDAKKIVSFSYIFFTRGTEIKKTALAKSWAISKFQFLNIFTNLTKLPIARKWKRMWGFFQNISASNQHNYFTFTLSPRITCILGPWKKKLIVQISCYTKIVFVGL